MVDIGIFVAVIYVIIMVVLFGYPYINNKNMSRIWIKVQSTSHLIYGVFVNLFSKKKKSSTEPFFDTKIIKTESSALSLSVILLLILILWQGIDYSLSFEEKKIVLSSVFWTVTADNLIPALMTLMLGILTWRSQVHQNQLSQLQYSAYLDEKSPEIEFVHTDLDHLVFKNTGKLSAHHIVFTLFLKVGNTISIEQIHKTILGVDKEVQIQIPVWWYEKGHSSNHPVYLTSVYYSDPIKTRSYFYELTIKMSISVGKIWMHDIIPN